MKVLIISLDFSILSKDKVMVIFAWILRDKTMDDKLMFIPIDDKQNYPFCIQAQKMVLPSKKFVVVRGGRGYKSV